MKAARWYGVRDVRVEEVPEPVIQPGMVKIKVKWCGICGTDLHEYLAGPIFIPKEPHPLTLDSAPIILGHEFAGEVIEVGKGVTKVQPGDRVAVEPILACGRCLPCQRGLYNICDQLGFHGLSGGGGGFSEVTMVAERMVHKLPDGMSDREGALVEPAAVALHAIRQSRLSPGDSCVVFGAGPIGLLVIQAAKIAGASSIIAVEISEKRRQLAAQMGAHYVLDPSKTDVVEEITKLTGGGADVCFEVTGVEAALNAAIESSRVDGQVVIVSVWEGIASIPPNSLVLKEREIRGILAYRDIFPAVIQLIAEGTFQLNGLITREIPLSYIVKGGFEELAGSKNQIKVLVGME